MGKGEMVISMIVNMDDKKMYCVVYVDHKMVVAVYNLYIKDWAAYMDVVVDRNSSDYLFVAKNGNKIPQHLAEILFIEVKDKYMWRD